MQRNDSGILKNDFIDQADMAAAAQQAVQEAMQQWTLNQNVTEGMTVTLPNTNSDITLNLLTVDQSLTQVNVVLPGNTDGRVGQRCFVNSNGQIATVSFSSALQVNNADVGFSPGDNYAYYRNMPNIWSRITS